MDQSNPSQAQEDFNLLIIKICNELKKRDRGRNGLILYHSFVEVMEHFQIDYGTQLMDYLMKNCYVTEDGFVNYKNLLMLHDPSRSNRNNSEYVAESMNPRGVELQDAYNEDCTECLKAKNEIIRILYAQWDKCVLRDEEFVSKLRGAKVDITPEFLRVLATYGPSRSLKFGDVMRSLYINANDRKCRSTYVGRTPAKDPQTSFDENVKCFQEPHRNPITWADANNMDINTLFDNAEKIAAYFASPEQQHEPIDKFFVDATIKNIIKMYIGNKLPEKSLRYLLDKLDFNISNELFNLIKQHESDNNGRFKDFSAAIYKCMPKEMLSVLQRNVAESNLSRGFNSAVFYNGNSESNHDVKYCDKYANKVHDYRTSTYASKFY